MSDGLVACLRRILTLQESLPTVQDIYYPHSPSLEPSQRAPIPELLPFSLHKVFNDLPEGAYSVVTAEDLTRLLAILYAWLPEECKSGSDYTPSRLMEALQHPGLPAWEDYEQLTSEMEALYDRCQHLTAQSGVEGNCPACWNPIHNTTRQEGEPGHLECAGCHHTWPNQESLTSDRLARIRAHNQPGITITWQQVLDLWQPIWARKTLEKYRRLGLFQQHQGCFDLAEVNLTLAARC